MAKRIGGRPSATKRGKDADAPDAGDLIWISFSPQAGREQAGRRPGLVLSPRSYNDKVGLCVVCPITHHAKGYAFEVALPDDFAVQGVVLADHLKSADWRERGCEHIATAPPEILDEIRAKLKPLLGMQWAAMNFLAIETSCDETSVAVFTDDLRILANVVASQIDLHARFGGVVPEVAARAHLQRLLPTMDEALKQAQLKLADIGAIVVMNSPGLVGALLVGVSAAKMLALTLDVPLLSANHIEAHIFAARLAANRDIFPCVGLVVSGGHTSLFHCKTSLDFDFLGGTIDDAAGEAFDKVAAILGLGFPGGPAVEREASLGDPKAYALPRSFLHEDRLEFSFSGLKTAVRYALYGVGITKGPLPGPGAIRANLAASFQHAVVDVLVAKCRQTLRKTNQRRLAVGGGVCANRALRAALEAMAQREGVEIFIPPMSLCTDNAAMAAVAVEKWRQQIFSPLDLDAVPTYQGKN